MTPIYLDNSFRTRPSEKAVVQMLPYLSEKWGLATAPHQMGQRLNKVISESLKKIYDLLGASEEDDILLTSSGVEAINQAIFSGYFDIMQTTGKNQFVTSVAEDAPIYLSMERLEKLGAIVKHVALDAHGVVTADAIADQITPRTAMVSLSWASGLTGVIHPVEEISEICQKRGIRFHLDATHVFGKLYFDLEDVGADLITWNGLPLHAPTPSGGIWIKKELSVSPFILGSSDQGGLRGGELNVPALVAMAKVLEEAFECRDLMGMEVARLRGEFEKKIVEAYPDAQVLFQNEQRLPHCTAIVFPGVAAEALLYRLNQEGVFATVGGGSTQQLAAVLPHAGVSQAHSHSAVSFSLSRETTYDEIERASHIVGEVANSLRKLSNHLIPR